MVLQTEIPSGAYLLFARDPIETERVLLELSGADLFGFGGRHQGQQSLAKPQTALFWGPDANFYFIFDNVFDELASGLRQRGLDETRTELEIVRILKMVGLDDVFRFSRNLSPFALSGGQQQRLLAAVLASRRPQTIMAFNPLVFVDALARPSIFRFVAEEIVKQEGVIIVGGVVSCDLPTDLYGHEVLISDGTLCITPRKVDPEQIEYGGEVESPPLNARPDLNTTVIDKRKSDLLAIRNLLFKYPNGNIGVEVPEMKIGYGHLYVVCGPNGGGKSSLMRLIIMGGQSPKTGEYCYNGDRIKDPFSELALTGRLAFSMQEPNLHLTSTTVGEYLAANRVADEHVKSFQISGFLNEDLLSAPFWVRQAAVTLTTLTSEAELLIMDEPADGIAYSIFGRHLEQYIEALVSRGKAIVLSTHNSSLCKNLSPAYVWVENHYAQIIDTTSHAEFTVKWKSWLGNSKS